MYVRPRPRGFTLIEVLVVVVLLGIATSIVLPRVRDSTSGRRALRLAVNQLASAAITASEQAAYRRTVYVLRLDLVAGTFAIAPRRATSDDAKAAALLATGTLPEGISITSVARHFASAAGQGRDVIELRFAPDGWAEAATIELVAPTGARGTVEIHELGGIVETEVDDPGRKR